MSGVDVGQLFSELQRRQVFRALAAYAAVGWLLIEVASVVVPVMEWPQRVIRLLIYAVVAGLPVCLVGAWFLDLTPVGIRREPASDEDSSGAPGADGTGTSRAFYGFLAGLLVAALGLALYSGSRPTDTAPSLAEAELLARDGHYLEAFTVMAGMPADVLSGPDVEPLWLMTSDRLTLVTEPAGARVHGEYLADAGQAPVRVDLGATPLIDIAVARHDLLLTIEADGFESRELLVSGRFDRQESFLADQAALEFQLALRPEASAAPSRSLPVPGGTYMLVSADIPTGQAAELEDFEIDRFEVSNADYLAFVRAGGYRDDRHWDAAAHLGTASRSAMTDQTGLPAPRPWSGQEPAADRLTHPVVGVSWYEADAFCRWAGKALPSAFQWEKASRDGRMPRLGGFAMPWGLATVGESLDQRANFSSGGLVPVDRYPFGQSTYGLYNTAGNAKEWLLNASGENRVVIGGSWRDPAYLYSEYGSLAPDAASDVLGFRCASPDRVGGEQPLEVEITPPEYQPVDRQQFEAFLERFRYDAGAGTARVEGQVESADWTRYELSYPGPAGERVTAYFWEPARGAQPYQVLVTVPHAGAFYGMKTVNIIERHFAPLIRDGRAVFSVVMKGMTGREWGENHSPPATDSVRFRDTMVRHATELRLGLDYLSQRDDVDMTRLAYAAISWGAGSRLVLAAVDDRYRAVVLIGGGIDERVKPTLPEVDNVNFAPYIGAPILMVNGLQDDEHPWPSRGLPLWNLLPEPKELVLIDGAGHVPGDEHLIPAVKTFLDAQFGPP